MSCLRGTLSVGFLALMMMPVGSAGATVARSSAAHSRPARHRAQSDVAQRAPNGPPLSSIASLGQSEAVTGVPAAQGDQLVENGLGSPLCRGSTSIDLSSVARSNCQTSGFVGAAAPTNNYAFDVHIDVGALGISKGGLLSVLQDVFVAPLWNAIVWAVHALVVMLEWCYTLELLGGSTMGSVAGSLRESQRSFTEPWLAFALAAASVLAVYNGLVRRRVADTLAQTLMTLAMVVAGLWVIADPLGTVGAVGQWANQASIGTLGAVTEGSASNAPRTLGDGMRAVFGGAIEMPWCYLEFGNVRWCSDPALLDPRLHRAALGIVATQQAKRTCHSTLLQPVCESLGAAAASTIEHSAQLVRDADTNGKLFLAFPANGPERNSVTRSSSLLHVLCQTEDDTKCSGPTAVQAEFRSDSGTFPRVLGVLLIATGVLGMLLIFGLVALHLLIAAVVSLFMLLLAPFVVLAPAFGDGGRALFGKWLTRLLGAVTSKLLFSFLLGALLTLQRILVSLPLGWWTQWLLISACWWALFFKRHQVSAVTWRRNGEPARQRPPSIARRVGTALETPRAVWGAAGWARRKILRPAPDSQPRKRAHATRATVHMQADDEQTARTLELDHSEARARVRESPCIQAQLSSKGTQLERVKRAREAAIAAGDTRRAAKLGVRGERIEAALDREQLALGAAHRMVAEGERTERVGGSSHTTAQREERARFLDAQAALPSSSRASKEAARRDYPALVALAGYGREQYARLDPRGRREARLRVDRELALRSRLRGTSQDVGRARTPEEESHEQRKVERELDHHVLEQRTSASAATRSESSAMRLKPQRDLPTFGKQWPAAGRDGGAAESKSQPAGGPPKSRVMDDARMVAERRKRQLGYGPNR